MPIAMYLKPESSWVKQDLEFNMELYYKDELHLIEKGYEKLANITSKILKDPKKDLHDYPNINYDQPVIKSNTYFFLLCQQNPCYQLSQLTQTILPPQC